MGMEEMGGESRKVRDGSITAPTSLVLGIDTRHEYWWGFSETILFDRVDRVVLSSRVDLNTCPCRADCVYVEGRSPIRRFSLMKLGTRRPRI